MFADDTQEPDAGAIDKKLLEELRAFMQQKMQADARGRLGKPPLPVEGELPLEGGEEGLEAPPPMEGGEDETIPGVEAVPAEGGAAAPGMDLEKMKAALAGMKRG